MKTKKFTKAQLMSAYEELDDVAGIQPPIVWTTQELFERELYETIVQLNLTMSLLKKHKVCLMTL